MEKTAPVRPGVVAKTVEISWHAQAVDMGHDAARRKGGAAKGALAPEARPVHEVAFQPALSSGTGSSAAHNSNKSDRLRLATVGGDGFLKIWDMNLAAADSFLFGLGHRDMQHVMSLAANEPFELEVIPSCLRWSPNGLIAAVGCFTGSLALFRRDHSGTPFQGCSEKWSVFRRLKLTDEVTDVSFSPDSAFVMAVTRTGAVQIFAVDSVRTADVWHMYEMHQRIVSCAWDPWNRFIATFGSDPALKVSLATPRVKDENKIDVSHERKAAAGLHVEGDYLATARMAYSPDGMLLAVPFGKSKGGDAPRCVYVYTRDATDRPTVKLGLLEGRSSPPQGVAWAPGFFEPLSPADLAKSAPAPPAAKAKDATATAGSSGAGPSPATEEVDEVAARLPWGPHSQYRMALAVWNEDTVVVYTTDSSGRYAFFNNLHVNGITTVSWSPCARYLLVSSLDCYVSVVHFYVPIGVFHPTLAFVPAPSAASLLHGEMARLTAKGRGIEERVACDKGDDASGGAGDGEAVTLVVGQSKKKKARVEATPVLANAEDLAAQF